MQRGHRSSSDEVPLDIMWSSLSRFFRGILGAAPDTAPSFLLPQDVDKLRTDFDRVEEIEGPGGPITAREAFELALSIVQEFDDQARLSKIESCGQLDPEGKAEGWRFLFDLPQRWGKASFTFDCKSSKETVSVKLRPFVASGSALDKMLEDGRVGFVEQQWKVELERSPGLSHNFVDSPQVMEDWISDGTTASELSDRTLMRGLVPPLGKPRWEILTSADSKKSLYSRPIE